MKNLLFTVAVLTSTQGFSNDLKLSQDFQKALDTYHVEKDKEEAIDLMEEIMENVTTDHPKFGEMYQTLLEFKGVEVQEQLTKAINFVTGSKDEYYCKNIGLVLINATHNDGTESKLVLTDSSRVAPSSYAVMREGRWTYALDTGYREPIESELWINEASRNNFNVEELRTRKNGKDKGHWKYQWSHSKKSRNRSASTSSDGNGKEPVPMYMALDYHLWGADDLGYGIKFEVGATESFRSEKGTFSSNGIKLKTERKVVEHLDKLTVKDFSEKERTYQDCFKVNSKIEFYGLVIK